MNDAFSGYHPVVNFIWFVAVIAFSMLSMHPVTQLTALACAAFYSARLTGGKAVRGSLKYLLPLMLLTAALNPIFNHEGATILVWLPSGNPLTLEAILYGLAAAVMLATVVEWFVCFNRVICSDKFVYLFGRVLPVLGLLLSMTLRFVPFLSARIKAAAEAQKALGRDVSSGSLLKRMRLGLKILSAAVTWSLESAIETADSMKSRGYGLPGRTFFSVFLFERRDAYALCFTLFCSVYIFTAAVTGGIDWRYYPAVTGVLGKPYTISTFLVWLALCAMPLYLEAKEEWKWKSSISAV
ncbi:MAG: energy-coupling factor transporter transmembrane component T [Oscillospiraceae bacterium]|nr:energy-coupling factor transporter transmembrane component T [Oscillospiraceae bacterium]